MAFAGFRMICRLISFQCLLAARTFLLVLALLAGFASPGAAEPVLQRADIHVVMQSADACDVTMRMVVDGAGPVDHRITASDDSQIVVAGVRGATQTQEIRAVGATRSLMLEPSSTEYEIAYTAAQPSAGHRCPLWVPAAPADGVSRRVRITVALPPGTEAHGTMPAFDWQEGIGTSTLGHVPAFVRVPFAGPGESMPWDLAATMDTLTIAVFVVASGIWIWRRRR